MCALEHSKAYRRTTPIETGLFDDDRLENR